TAAKATQLGVPTEQFQATRNFEISRAERLADLRKDLTREYPFDDSYTNPGFYEDRAEMYQLDIQAQVEGATAKGIIGETKYVPEGTQNLRDYQPAPGPPGDLEGFSQKSDDMTTISTRGASTYALPRAWATMYLIKKVDIYQPTQGLRRRFEAEDVPAAKELNPTTYYATEH
ncbi:MAG: hypothetical protein GY739_05085, partial [Mesoflavibacter sp.]|nr:hypothetical protein [Mesoflavibacter sp.]